MRTISKWIPNFWKRERSFSQLLLALAFFIFFVIPFITEVVYGRIIFLFFYYLLLTSSTPFLLEKNRSNITAILFVVPFTILIIEIIWHSAWTQLLENIFLLSYFLMLGTIILFITFDQGRINIRRVQGAVIVYLLIGLIFSTIFHSIYIISSSNTFNGVSGTHKQNFIYYSLCTLTTVGYGDIAPLSPLARSLSNLEALIGQLFPAIFIARLISMEISYESKRRNIEV
ncbi:MAG TPA: potassium channel family protein [Puia sp.]